MKKISLNALKGRGIVIAVADALIRYDLHRNEVMALLFTLRGEILAREDAADAQADTPLFPGVTAGRWFSGLFDSQHCGLTFSWVRRSVVAAGGF